MRRASAQTNVYEDSRQTYQDRTDQDRKPEGDARIPTVTGRGYEETMRIYRGYANETRERDRDRDRSRDNKR